MPRISARVQCPHCDSPHFADLGEDGMPDLDLVKCQGSDECEEKLCEDCRHKCEICGHWACENHVAANSEGVKVCDICRSDVEPEPECECQNVTGRWDLDETWDARDCRVHGGAL